MKLSTRNQRYLEIDGKPTVLMASAEHYGALLNLDFDYATYFETLGRLRLNQTRVFSGTYRERPGHFEIEANTLVPQPGRFICPWSEIEPDRFDLESRNDAYFARLRDLLEHAVRHGIIVELVLFCFLYSDDHWRASPMHPANTTQAVGPHEHHAVYTVAGNPLLPAQERVTRELVTATSEFDNVYYEICNEPYSRHDGTADLEWQHHMVDVVAETERSLGKRHLIAMNYQNRTHVIPEVHPEVSIINFHYALPEAVIANAHFGLPIADDETGFAGQTAEPYRREAWGFFLSGGAAFSHLDYGFTCAHPDGTAPIVGNTPGYGGDDLRRQLVFLRDVLEENEVWELRPANEVFAQVSSRLDGRILCDPGRLYLVYIPENAPGATLSLWLPVGRYLIEWMNPVTCTYTHTQKIDVAARPARIATPSWSGDLAFRLTPVS